MPQFCSFVSKIPSLSSSKSQVLSIPSPSVSIPDGKGQEQEATEAFVESPMACPLVWKDPFPEPLCCYSKVRQILCLRR